MFCLKIAAPFHVVIKVCIVFLKKLYSFGICYSAEIRVYYGMESVKKAFVYKAVEELHLFRCIFQNIIYNKLKHVFRKVHIILKIRKGYFGFYHPKFCRMSCSIGIFRSECRSECIYISECHCIRFGIKLTAYRKICTFSEEIFAVVHLAVFHRGICRVNRCNSEHFACALAVTSGYDRSVSIDKASFVEKLMYGICRKASYSENRRKGIRSGSEVSNSPQKFKRVSFLLKRIVRC